MLKLLLFDVETSSLHTDRLLLEFGARRVDMDLGTGFHNELDRLSVVIPWARFYIGMQGNPVALRMHEENGLIDESGKLWEAGREAASEAAFRKIETFVAKHAANDVHIAGKNVHFDIDTVERELRFCGTPDAQTFDGYSHRRFDLSTLRLIAAEFTPDVDLDTPTNHRIDSCLDSFLPDFNNLMGIITEEEY